METFKDRIRKARGGRTMVEFAELIGITQQKVSNYENGVDKPTFEVFQLLAAAGFSTNWLLTGEGEMYISQCGGDKELKAEIERLRIENEAVKKMAGLEAIQYIQNSLLNPKNTLPGTQKRKKK